MKILALNQQNSTTFTAKKPRLSKNTYLGHHFSKEELKADANYKRVDSIVDRWLSKLFSIFNGKQP